MEHDIRFVEETNEGTTKGANGEATKRPPSYDQMLSEGFGTGSGRTRNCERFIKKCFMDHYRENGGKADIEAIVKSTLELTPDDAKYPLRWETVADMIEKRWATKPEINLDLDDNGRTAKSRKNLRTILEDDPEIDIRYNLLTKGTEYVKLPKIADGLENNAQKKAALVKYIDNKYAEFSLAKLDELLEGQPNAFDPAKDYLETVEADESIEAGKSIEADREYLETFLFDYVGVEDNHMNRLKTVITFVGCVARIFEPGCKLDTMLVLAGDTGMGKSTLLSRLAPNAEWFNDSVKLKALRNDMNEVLRLAGTSWIIEIAELDGMGKVEVENVRSFLSASKDKYRNLYEKYGGAVPRRFVLFGTANETKFIRDSYTRRRFLVLECRKVRQKKHPSEMTAEEVNKFWKCAVALYRDGVKWWIPPDSDDEKALDTENVNYADTPAIMDDIEQYLDTFMPPNFQSWPIELRQSFCRTTDREEWYEDKIEDTRYKHYLKAEHWEGDGTQTWRQMGKTCVNLIATEALGFDGASKVPKNITDQIKDCMRDLERKGEWKPIDKLVKVRGVPQRNAYERMDDANRN